MAAGGSDWVVPETYVEGFHDLDTIRKMRYRVLPNIGLVSVVGFGASGLGGMHVQGSTGITNVDDNGGPEADVWWMEDSMEEKKRAKEVVVAYLKAGGNIIDTSHWYGQGKSERLLGFALQGIPRKAYYLLSKACRYDTDLPKQFDFTYDRTYQAVLDSLKRLQVDYLDVMQVHDPEFAPSAEVVVNGAVRALAEHQKNGRVKHVGMTGYPIDYQEMLIRQCYAAGYRISTSLTYCRYTLIDTYLVESSFWKTCQELGVGVINASPIAMGLLMERPCPDWHPASEATKAKCNEAVRMCKAVGVDISKIAQYFCVREERLATTLVSTTNPDRLARNLAVAWEPLSDVEEKTLLEIRSFFARDGNHHWEGAEVDMYWKKLGPMLMLEKHYSK